MRNCSRGSGLILGVMQDNIADVAGDSSAVRSSACTSHREVDCIGEVFWVVITPTCVLSCRRLLVGQYQERSKRRRKSGLEPCT